MLNWYNTVENWYQHAEAIIQQLADLVDDDEVVLS